MRAWVVALFVVSGCGGAEASKPTPPAPKAVVVVSANAEWKAVRAAYPNAHYEPTPWGETFTETIGGAAVVFFHGGWGKVAAAGSAQYAIDRWHPRTVINLGTCGGFAGSIAKHAVVLVDRTVIYDIEEAMGDSAEAIADYSVNIDLSWWKGPYPSAVTKTLLVSADRDLVGSQIEGLRKRYGAVAGDWESGAIAYTCARNHQRLLVLRGVTDVVSSAGSELYANENGWVEGAGLVMRGLLAELPAWLAGCP